MKVLQNTLKQQGNYFDRNNNKFNNNQGKLFNSLNEYRYNDVKSKRKMTHSCTSKHQYARPTSANKSRWKYIVWRLQVTQLQPKIRMRSQVAVILTQQQLSEPAL
ncbi:Hypothetical_protein [Hexamita inflata]|uniref:Hypothetical_protein n=1 Tax=Hexamita inflata TaxID=28002 RepID=A0ABP1I033_9EUKA